MTSFDSFVVCLPSTSTSSNEPLFFSCNERNCQRRFQLHCGLRSHRRNEHNAAYACRRKACSFVFSCASDVSLHERTYHASATTLLCVEADCSVTCTNVEQLKAHTLAAHADTMLHCTVCRMAFADEPNRDWHVARAHGQRERHCLFPVRCGCCARGVVCARARSRDESARARFGR